MNIIYNFCSTLKFFYCPLSEFHSTNIILYIELPVSGIPIQLSQGLFAFLKDSEQLESDSLINPINQFLNYFRKTFGGQWDSNQGIDFF